MKVVDGLFEFVMGKNCINIIPQPHKLRSCIGDFLARGEYDICVYILKSLRIRCVKAYKFHAISNSQLSQQIKPFFEQEFNDLISETQAAALRLTGCKLPVRELTGGDLPT